MMRFQLQLATSQTGCNTNLGRGERCPVLTRETLPVQPARCEQWDIV